MIGITADTYRLIASRLGEEIAAADWFNSFILIDFENFEARLTLTAIIYRRTEILPEGPRRPITDVVPVWWEFSTTLEDAVGTDGIASPDGASRRQVSNDFSFNELKPYLIDYD